MTPPSAFDQCGLTADPENDPGQLARPAPAKFESESQSQVLALRPFDPAAAHAPIVKTERATFGEESIL